MKNLLALTISALYLVSCTPQNKLDIPKISDKVVELHVLHTPVITLEGDVKSPSSIGTGFFISNDGLILTAAHCVRDSIQIVVITSDKKEYVASIVLISGTDDVATIKISKDNTPYFTLAKTLEVGEEINIIGSPLAITSVYMKGYVAKLDGSENLLNIGVLPGYSGSPVFNNKGELVGVISKLIVWQGAATSIGVSVSLEAIRDFVAIGLSR